MAISIIHVVKNSLKFTSVNVIAFLIGTPVAIYVATILVPEEYGVFGFLGLWAMYAGLIGPGITSAGQREIPVLLGRNKEKEALRIQNISITSEMLYSIIPFIVILGASFFFSESILKFGLIIIAISYAVGKTVAYWPQMNYIREKFSIVAKGNLILAIVPPIVIAASVYWLRIYALLIAPIVGYIILWIYYRRKGPINFHFRFDKSEVIRLVKVGVVLQAMTLAFWGFRMADRTIIAAMLPFEQLGLYTYAMGFIMMILMIPGDFKSILQPILWREAGKANNILEGFIDTKRIAVYIALGVSVLIPLAQLGFYAIVNLITTKYINSIPIFYVLSYTIYLASIGAIPKLILNSSIVNKQKITLCFNSIGLALNIIFSIIVIKLGYGVVGVAWVTICTQGLVAFILYRFIKGYIFEDTKEFLRFIVRILFPFLITIPFYFFHNYLSLITANFWTFAGISLVVQLVLWSLVISVFYRGYISINDIKTLMKEINTIIEDRLHLKK